MPPALARLRPMLLNYKKGVSRVAIDDGDSLRQDAMKRLLHKTLGFRFEIPSRDFESLRGAVHLIYSTRHPFRFSCKCPRCAQFVHMVNSTNDKELDVSLCTSHTKCALCAPSKTDL